MDALRRDLRYAFRSLWRDRGFALVAVLVLALGIGANAAVFSIVNVGLFRPLVAADPERLVGCFSKNTEKPDSYRAFSYPEYTDLREQSTVFSDLTAHTIALVGLSEGDATRRVFADVVAANFFRTFGVPLYRGRSFAVEEERPGADVPVVIVSYAFWQRRGADPGFLGRTLQINGRPYTVVGIAPEGFSATMALVGTELWLPLGVHDAVVNDFMKESGRRFGDRDAYELILVARLQPGVTLARADEELAAIASRMAEAYPEADGEQTFHTARLPRLGISTEPSDDSAFAGLAVLLSAMAGVVLLIAALNLANLMLARGAGRRKELAIRQAIGGRRAALVRQLLVEGFVLSLIGGAVGLLVAWAASGALVASLTSIVPIELKIDTSPDVRVVAATLGFCLLSTLLFALVPAFRLTRMNLVSDLREGAGALERGKRRLVGRSFGVVAQIALSLALLTAAGLFVRAALRAAHADPGFRLDRLVLAEIDPSLAGYDEERSRALYRDLQARLAALPGFESVALAATVPYGMVSMGKRVVAVGGQAPGGEPAPVSSRSNTVGPGYFATLGVPLLRGREFDEGEGMSGIGGPVAVVDQLLARKLWPEGEPLGRRIQFVDEEGSPKSEEMTVVGVVPALQDDFFEKDRPHVFIPFGQDFQSDMHFYLRTAAGGPGVEQQVGAVREALRATDPGLPVLALKTFPRHLRESFSLWLVRAGADIFLVLGGMALLLAVVGVYGLRAYSVARRTREIGIRMAVGSTAGQALWMVLREGLRLTAFGAGLGLLLAAGLSQLLGGFLYEVRGLDPVAFAVAPAVLVAATLVACLIPARRAARIDPLRALQAE